MSDKKVYLQDIELAQAADIPVLPELATVATSGNYDDLENKPLIYSEGEQTTITVEDDEGDISHIPYELARIVYEDFNLDITDRTGEWTISYTEGGDPITIGGTHLTLVPDSRISDQLNLLGVLEDESTRYLVGISSNDGSVQDYETVIFDDGTCRFVFLNSEPPTYTTREDVASYNMWDKLDHPIFAAVATSGSYNDLLDTPESPFVATYDQTSYTDVKNAIDANKPIVVDFPNNMNLIIPTYCTYVVNGNITMHGVFKSDTDTNVSIITLTPQNAWSISHTALQPKLASGTNIKTVNGNSLLGSGDLLIEGGTSDYDLLENKPLVLESSSTEPVDLAGENSDLTSLREYLAQTYGDRTDAFRIECETCPWSLFSESREIDRSGSGTAIVGNGASIWAEINTGGYWELLESDDVFIGNDASWEITLPGFGSSSYVTRQDVDSYKLWDKLDKPANLVTNDQLANYYTKAEVDAAIQAAIEPFMPPESLHPFFANTSSQYWVSLSYIDQSRQRFIGAFTDNGWGTCERKASGNSASMFADLRPAPLTTLDSSASYVLKIEAKESSITNPAQIAINVLSNATNNQLNPPAGQGDHTLTLQTILENGYIELPMVFNSLSAPRLVTIQIRDIDTDTTDGEFKLRFSLNPAS